MAHFSRTRLGKHVRTLTAAVAMLALMPGFANAAELTLPPPSVPAAIKVPAGNVPFLLGHATGTQNYICKRAGNGFEWTFVAPSATLVDDSGKQIMTHFGGPTWQAKDGSKVVAARVDGVTVSPDAIPWLLLKATSTTPGPDGGDRLTGTTFIQRVNTTGGLAPTTGCNGSNVGATRNVSYTSDYFFYRAVGS